VETIGKTSLEANRNTLSNKGWLKVLQIIGGIGSGKLSHFSSITRSSSNLKVLHRYNNASAKLKSSTCTVIYTITFFVSYCEVLSMACVEQEKPAVAGCAGSGRELYANIKSEFM